jgi:hypothetical protein
MSACTVTDQANAATHNHGATEVIECEALTQ